MLKSMALKEGRQILWFHDLQKAYLQEQLLLQPIIGVLSVGVRDMGLVVVL
jgi:hypothetical protein